MSYIGRFGISMLSTSRKNDAFPWEVMIDHNLGMVSVKNSNGEMISYDEIDRIGNHCNKFTTACNNRSFYADIYEVNSKDSSGNKLFPCAISYEDFSKPLNINDTFLNKHGASRLAYSIDSELVSINTETGDYTLLENTVKFKITVSVTYKKNNMDFIKDVIIQGTSDEIRHQVVNFGKIEDAVNIDCKIKSIEVVSFPDQKPGEKLRLLVFSILNGRYTI